MRLLHTRRGFLVGVLCIVFAQTLSGCSSSEVTESDAPDALIPPPEAGTDPVPEASAETPAPSTDFAQSEAPPVDVPPAEVPAADVPPASADVTPPADPFAEPAPAAAEASADPIATPSPSSSSYTTRGGDTLMKIAFETYGDLTRWKEIFEANRGAIQNPNRIPAGTVLQLAAPATPVVIEKNGERYHIRRGDTLGTISRELYGTSSKWKDIWNNNRQLIKNPNKIYAGFDLYYQPMSSPSAPTPLAETPLGTEPVPREPATAGGVTQSP